MAKIIIKAGGALAHDPARTSIARDVAALSRMGHHVLLVHGGGPQLDEAIKEQNRTPQKVAGRRVTSEQDLQLAIQIWRGKLAVQWVQSLHNAGAKAIAISGQDGGLISATKRPEVSIQADDGKQMLVDFGLVGDIQAIDPSLVELLWQGNLIPVVSPLGGSKDGSVLNINADTIATKLAIELQADQLILLSNINGVLLDPSNPKSIIPSFTPSKAQQLINDGVISKGMRPKVESILCALDQGVQHISIANGTQVGILSDLLIQQKNVGTRFALH